MAVESRVKRVALRAGLSEADLERARTIKRDGHVDKVVGKDIYESIMLLTGITRFAPSIVFLDLIDAVTIEPEAAQQLVTLKRELGNKNKQVILLDPNPAIEGTIQDIQSRQGTKTPFPTLITINLHPTMIKTQ